jgi:hypothetical protein
MGSLYLINEPYSSSFFLYHSLSTSDTWVSNWFNEFRVDTFR